MKHSQETNYTTEETLNKGGGKRKEIKMKTINTWIPKTYRIKQMLVVLIVTAGLMSAQTGISASPTLWKTPALRYTLFSASIT